MMIDGIPYIECRGPLCNGKLHPNTDEYFYPRISFCIPCTKSSRTTRRNNYGTENFIKYKIQHAKDNAKRKGLVFDLTLDIILNKLEEQKWKCALSKVKLVTKLGHPKELSIDRIDFKKGYTADNIQLITFPLNRLKGHFEYNIEKLRSEFGVSTARKVLKSVMKIRLKAPDQN